MSLLDAPRTPRQPKGERPPARPRPLRAVPGIGQEAPAGGDEVVDVGSTRIDPSGEVTYRGMRIRRVRLSSVATLAAVFWLLLGAVVLGTIVVVWNVAQSFGFVESFEETVTTSLGLERFDVDGGGIFGIVAAGVAGLCVLGWATTIALAAVYNAACGVFGGLAVETGPLRRRRRVFSWRHRRFVTVTR